MYVLRFFFFLSKYCYTLCPEESTTTTTTTTTTAQLIKQNQQDRPTDWLSVFLLFFLLRIVSIRIWKQETRKKKQEGKVQTTECLVCILWGLVVVVEEGSREEGSLAGEKKVGAARPALWAHHVQLTMEISPCNLTKTKTKTTRARQQRQPKERKDYYGHVVGYRAIATVYWTTRLLLLLLVATNRERERCPGFWDGSSKA